MNLPMHINTESYNIIDNININLRRACSAITVPMFAYCKTQRMDIKSELWWVNILMITLHSLLHPGNSWHDDCGRCTRTEGRPARMPTACKSQ